MEENKEEREGASEGTYGSLDRFSISIYKNRIVISFTTFK
jgi:hypothetical protein